MRKLRDFCEAFGRSWWAVIVICLLTGVILYQRWQATHPFRPPTLAVGARVKTLTVQALNAQPISIAWSSSEKPTILYVFSPSCVHCRHNVEAVRKLADLLSASHRVIGLSTTREGLKEFLDKTPFPGPVYIMNRGDKQLKVIGTPETILLSPLGVVEKVWYGSYEKKTATDIGKVLGVTLPPVEPVQRAE
jgi:hypothetical protein